ncbi:MAG TPA: PaaI family thioesterase [Rhizomicrobium sp.]|jgi:uncharacterized protein (TIGR00369 family)
MSQSIPKGFRPLAFAMGFIEANGPLYGNWDGTRMLLGFRVEPRHCNPANVAHGGMLATFADMLLPIAARFQAKIDMGFLPTVNLTCDFLAPAPLGAWVEGRAEALRSGKTLLFAQGTAEADGKLCLRANGVFRVTGPVAGGFSPELMFKDA